MRRFLLHEQRINQENSLLNYLMIFCRTALIGVLSFYNGQTQAEGYLTRQGRRFYTRQPPLNGYLRSKYGDGSLSLVSWL